MSLGRIIADAEEAAGREVIERVRTGRLEPNRDLPIRQHETGQIVAWIPARYSAGLHPVIRDGLVVGYYRETDRGRLHAGFAGPSLAWVESGPGVECMCVFTKEGAYLGNRHL